MEVTTITSIPGFTSTNLWTFVYCKQRAAFSPESNVEDNWTWLCALFCISHQRMFIAAVRAWKHSNLIRFLDCKTRYITYWHNFVVHFCLPVDVSNVDKCVSFLFRCGHIFKQSGVKRSPFKSGSPAQLGYPSNYRVWQSLH